ncbi:MAG: hypothetical protein JW881_15260 [Spirochaetales bacterium]|nr:hypothetical protein [Spirochaetales bacterium]
MDQDISLLIGMRWNNSSTEVICRETERFLSWLSHTGFGNASSVHWNIPCHPFLEIRTGNLEDLIREIKSRTRNNGDIPIPMGFSGNLHPLLSLAELEKECEWSIANPWESGIQDIFDILPDSIIPALADVQRKEAADCYKKAGFRTIGIPLQHLSYLPRTFRDSTTRNEPMPFTFITPAPNMFHELKRGLKKQIEEGRSTFFFLFDCSLIEETVTIPFDYEPFTEVINELLSKHKAAFTTITALDDEAIRKMHDPAPFKGFSFIPDCPLWRKNAQSARNDRHLEIKTSRTYKDILRETSPFNLDHVLKKRIQPHQKSMFPPKERINEANMQGNAVLYGEAFSVAFLEGRIHHFIINNKKMNVGEKSRSFINYDDTDYDFQNLSAFSIQGERSRGLRESQKISIEETGKPGIQLTDYYFVDDFQYLLVTSKITYPLLRPKSLIAQLSPFELPLLRFTKNETITIYIHSAFSISSFPVPHEQRKIITAGELFVVEAKDYCILIGYPEKKGSGLQFLEFRVDDEKKEYILKANPFGTYIASPPEWYNGITEIYTFYIGVDTAVPDVPPDFPAGVLNEIPRDTVYVAADKPH